MASQQYSPTIIKPNLLGCWFGKLKQITLDDKYLLLKRKNSAEQIRLELGALLDFPSIKQAFWGSKVSFSHASRQLDIAFLSKSDAGYLADMLERHCIKNFARQAGPLIALFNELTQEEYLRDSNIALLDSNLLSSVDFFTKNMQRLRGRMQSETFSALEKIASCYPLSVQHAKVRASFEQRQLETRKEFYDRIEANPLTLQQRLSVIRNNDINMVLAAAGTGKTSVMVAKALDLLDSKRAEAGDILIMAYNRDAAAELRQRLKQRAQAAGQQLCEIPEIATFHSLGRKIIKDCGASVQISTFADDSLAVEIWLTQ